MTSENLYKHIVDQKCEHYMDMVIDDLVKYDVEPMEYTGDLREYKLYLDKLQRALSDVRTYTVPSLSNSFNINGGIREALNGEFLRYAQAKADFESKAIEMREKDRAKFDAQCEEEEKAAFESLSPLKKKHNTLLSYQDKLKGVMDHYGITPTDMEISPDITREEFEALLDASIAICEKTDNKLSGIVAKITSPLYSEEDSVAMVYSVVGLLASWLLLPVIGVIYTATMIKNTKSMYSNLDALRIAESLMHTVDYTKFIPEEDRYVRPEYDPSEIEAEIERMREAVESANPQIILDRELRAYNTTEGINYGSEMVAKKRADAEKLYNTLLEDLETRYTAAKELVDNEMGNIKRLGDEMSKSAVMSTKYQVGVDDTGLPVYKDLGMTNINFVGTYNKSMISFLKVLWVNMLMNVRANCLETKIYDEEYLGQDFAEFITPQTAQYVMAQNSESGKLQEEMRKLTAESLMKIKNSSILEFNKEAEEQGMMTIQYHLYIYLSGLGDKYHENKSIMELTKYSANAGVFIWTVYPKEIPGCLNIKVPMLLDRGKPLEYDFDLGSRALETFCYDLKNNKPRALDYRKSYLMRYLPPEKWWKTSSISGINIRMGLQDGDPSKPYTLRFDDKNVHYLMGGATGSGKSVAIDCAMQSMLHEYSPDELNLVYIDMKNSEVAKYTDQGISRIPHALIISGTSDGEYCLSVFDWAFEEMIRRMNICSKYKMQKVEDLRKRYDDPSRSDYNPEVHIPRIVILIDEFQVMFDSSRIPTKIIDKITGRITSMVKLARAASIHLWFTSQEMSGTLAKNVLDNFSNRGALRCTKDVSTTLIGNDASGTIRDKVGWMYTNTSAGQDPNANQLWKVPYAPIEDLLLGMSELCEKADNEGIVRHKAPFYDEKQGRSGDLLEQAYRDEPNFNVPRFFVMGERTLYSTRTTPLNFAIDEDDKENLFVCASERQDCLDLINTLMVNINHSGGKADLLINSTDKDTNYLLDLESRVQEDDLDFLSPTYPTESLLEDLEDIYEYRSSLDTLENTKTMFIMCIMWEKKDGVGQSENFKIVGRLKELMTKLNQLKVHFVFVCREVGGLKDFVNLSKHRICAKADERACVTLIDDASPFKFPAPDGDNACFATYKYGSDARKFKIYRYKLERELEVREL